MIHDKKLYNSILFYFVNAGYKSRVRYLSVLDPTLMCYYTSEILDAGLPGPLFMVNKLRTPLHAYFTK